MQHVFSTDHNYSNYLEPYFQIAKLIKVAEGRKFCVSIDGMQYARADCKLETVGKDV